MKEFLYFPEKTLKCNKKHIADVARGKGKAYIDCR
jgi:hypothetical protein